jgi:hypothetical protein
MKHKKIMEMEIEEIKKEMQGSQKSQIAGREEEKLVHAFTIEEAKCSIHNSRRNGKSTTQGSD